MSVIRARVAPVTYPVHPLSDTEVAPAQLKDRNPVKTLVLTIAVVCCVSALSAQPLGEIAAATAARKEANADRTKPIAKTYTNTDLKSVTPVAPMTENPVALAPTPEMDTVRDKDFRGEVYWRNRLSPLLALRVRYSVHYDQAVDEVRRATPPWPPRGNEHAVALAQRSVDFWQHALDENQGNIEALREEARQAGALPGWLR